MTHICTTKEGTEIYREAPSHLSKEVRYRTERRVNGAIKTEVGLSWRQVEKIMRKEKLIEPLKEII
jgi:hypothetical protein